MCLVTTTGLARYRRQPSRMVQPDHQAVFARCLWLTSAAWVGQAAAVLLRRRVGDVLNCGFATGFCTAMFWQYFAPLYVNTRHDWIGPDDIWLRRYAG